MNFSYLFVFFVSIFGLHVHAKSVEASPLFNESTQDPSTHDTKTTSSQKVDSQGSGSNFQDSYLKETQDSIAGKDNRVQPLSKGDKKPLHHAKVDSALILDRYENKKFIKEKIQYIARDVVSNAPNEKTIAEKMGSAGSKKISVSIDENVNAKDAIMEIGYLAGISIEVDPNIESKGAILSLQNRKISDVFERVANLYKVNIDVRDNVVRFTANEPFVENYSITFVDSMSSGSTSSSATPSVGGNTTNNNVPSMSNLNNNSWVNNSGGTSGSVQSQNALNHNSAWQSNNSMWEQFEEGLKYIVSQEKDVNYSINKQAGLVTLNATSAIHREVKKYIEKIKKLAMTQILVEVRLVEVALEDEFTAGIDFNYISDSFGSSGSFIPGTVASVASSPFAATLRPGKASGITAAVQFLQTFGTTKTIASPRLNVMNNQKSRLSFATDKVYFTIQPQLQNQYTAPGVSPVNPSTPIVVQSTMHTIPIGVILDLQATADIDTDEILMNIRPTISTANDYVEDPAATFLSGLQFDGTDLGVEVTNNIPVVEKKELDSTLRIKSGDIMVIGGFNEEQTTIVRKGIPFLKDLPILKYIFGSDQQYVRNIETVIFIKATIMDSSAPLSDEDRRFYNDFA